MLLLRLSDDILEFVVVDEHGAKRQPNPTYLLHALIILEMPRIVQLEHGFLKG